jgi:hypothetical protein
LYAGPLVTGIGQKGGRERFLAVVAKTPQSVTESCSARRANRRRDLLGRVSSALDENYDPRKKLEAARLSASLIFRSNDCRIFYSSASLSYARCSGGISAAPIALRTELQSSRSGG